MSMAAGSITEYFDCLQNLYIHVISSCSFSCNGLGQQRSIVTSTTHLAELHNGFLMVSTFVRMKFQGKLPVRRIDFVERCITGHTQHQIMVDRRVSRHLDCSTMQVLSHDLYREYRRYGQQRAGKIIPNRLAVQQGDLPCKKGP